MKSYIYLTKERKKTTKDKAKIIIIRELSDSGKVLREKIDYLT